MPQFPQLLGCDWVLYSKESLPGRNVLRHQRKSLTWISILEDCSTEGDCSKHHGKSQVAEQLVVFQY